MKKLLYMAIYDADKYPGVDKKLRGFADVASRKGYDSRLLNFKQGSLIKSLLAMGRGLLAARHSSVVIRWPSYGAAFLFLPIIVARLRGCYVVADVPTPRSSIISEVVGTPAPFWKKSATLGIVLLEGPWVMWPLNRIIQYAEEGKWFSFFADRKTLVLGNGINVRETRLRERMPTTMQELRLVGVANVESWHGYDRVIKGIADWERRNDSEHSVFFTIVGGGGEIASLRRLVSELGLESRVTFTGKLIGDELSRQYESAHIAVGSLGLHRKGLRSASSLKDREYCSVGIPFLAGGSDPDFREDFTYRLQLPLTDEPLDIEPIVAWFSRISPINSRLLREYAVKNCDHEVKIQRILPA